MGNLELTEIEILEKENKQLKSDKQRPEEKYQGQRSTVSKLEKANDDLQQKIHNLQSETERNSDSERRLNEEISLPETISYQELMAAFDQKTEEEEQLFEDVQELRRNCAGLLHEKEKLEKQMEQMTEDTTVIILELLTYQDYLQEHLSRKTKILNTFSARALKIIKDARSKIEPASINVGEEGSEFHEYDNQTENVVNVMLWPLMEELNAINDAFRGALMGIPN